MACAAWQTSGLVSVVARSRSQGRVSGLRDLGRHQEALAAHEEAVPIYSGLAADNPVTCPTSPHLSPTSASASAIWGGTKKPSRDAGSDVGARQLLPRRKLSSFD